IDTCISEAEAAISSAGKWVPCAASELGFCFETGRSLKQNELRRPHDRARKRAGLCLVWPAPARAVQPLVRYRDRAIERTNTASVSATPSSCAPTTRDMVLKASRFHPDVVVWASKSRAAPRPAVAAEGQRSSVPGVASIVKQGSRCGVLDLLARLSGPIRGAA